jgi:hypothetical protein
MVGLGRFSLIGPWRGRRRGPAWAFNQDSAGSRATSEENLACRKEKTIPLVRNRKIEGEMVRSNGLEASTSSMSTYHRTER